MAKRTKEESYKKLATSELLDVDRAVLTDREYEKLDDTIDERQPFKYIESELKELRDMVEELQANFKQHDHKDGCLIKKI